MFNFCIFHPQPLGQPPLRGFASVPHLSTWPGKPWGSWSSSLKAIQFPRCSHQQQTLKNRWINLLGSARMWKFTNLNPQLFWRKCWVEEFVFVMSNFQFPHLHHQNWTAPLKKSHELQDGNVCLSVGNLKFLQGRNGEGTSRFTFGLSDRSKDRGLKRSSENTSGNKRDFPKVRPEIQTSHPLHPEVQLTPAVFFWGKFTKSSGRELIPSQKSTCISPWKMGRNPKRTKSSSNHQFSGSI